MSQEVSQIVASPREVMNAHGEKVRIPEGKFALCTLRKIRGLPKMLTADFFHNYKETEEAKKELEQDE